MPSVFTRRTATPARSAARTRRRGVRRARWRAPRRFARPGRSHSSVAVPPCSFHTLSPALLPGPRQSEAGPPSRGNEPLPVVRAGCDARAGMRARPPLIGRRHSVPLGLASGEPPDDDRPRWPRGMCTCRCPSGHAMRNALVHVEAVDPGARALRVAGEVEQRARIQEHRVATTTEL